MSPLTEIRRRVHRELQEILGPQLYNERSLAVLERRVRETLQDELSKDESHLGPSERTKITGEIDQFTLRYYRDVFAELTILGPFLNSFFFAVGSAVFATALGGCIAWIVTRTDAPLRALGYFTAFASFGTPFILYTIGWLLLLAAPGGAMARCGGCR